MGWTKLGAMEKSEKPPAGRNLCGQAGRRGLLCMACCLSVALLGGCYEEKAKTHSCFLWVCNQSSW